jgi:malonyl-CoA O-methyltransferase
MAGISVLSRPPIDIRQVRRNFSCHAEDYDRYARVQKRVAARLLHLVLPHIQTGTMALEVGTGTGELARRLLRLCPDASLVVSDLAHGMTRHAAETLGGLPAVDADAQALPFRSGRFELVLSASVFQWLNDLPAALAEGARVLRPGGLLAFAMYGERTLWELREAHRLAVQEAGDEHLSHAHTFPGEAEVGLAMEAAGLATLQLFAEDELEQHPDVAALLRSLKKIGAQNASSGRPAGLASRRVMHRLSTLYAERFGHEAQGIPATYHVIYGVARRA